jgi:hypothetical protein
MGRGPKPGKSKAEAKPPVARKSSKNGAARVSDLEKRLAEALRDKAEAQEQQAATAEILRVISQSVADRRATSVRHDRGKCRSLVRLAGCPSLPAP